MIKVKYLGRNGNKIFQYCFARILSNLLKIPFSAPPISWFENLKLSNFDKYECGKNIEKTIVLKRHIVDLKQLKYDARNLNLDITLEGYFQRSEYFINYKKEIKKWLKIDTAYQQHLKNKYTITENDVIIHVRLGDYFTLGYVINPFHIKKIIDKAKKENSRIFIVTDDPKSNYHHFFKEYNPILLSNSDKEDFYLMTCFENIIMSQSSFSWWSAFFASDTSKIYYPKTYDYGQWGINNKKEINLIEDLNFIGIEEK